MNASKAEAQANQYMGAAFMKWTGESKGNGAYYVGAGVFMLFCLAFFSVGGTIRNWVITSSVLSLFMGWGSNFETFNALLFEYSPALQQVSGSFHGHGYSILFSAFLWTLWIKRMDAV